MVDQSPEVEQVQNATIASTQRSLPSGRQLAVFVAGELFADTNSLVGSVEVVSSVELYKVTLRTTQNTLTTLPIID